MPTTDRPYSCAVALKWTVTTLVLQALLQECDFAHAVACIERSLQICDDLPVDPTLACPRSFLLCEARLVHPVDAVGACDELRRTVQAAHVALAGALFKQNNTVIHTQQL
jgi:hypothetical protein